jgi:hypothetical protein
MIAGVPGAARLGVRRDACFDESGLLPDPSITSAPAKLTERSPPRPIPKVFVEISLPALTATVPPSPDAPGSGLLEITPEQLPPPTAHAPPAVIVMPLALTVTLPPRGEEKVSPRIPVRSPVIPPEPSHQLVPALDSDRRKPRMHRWHSRICATLTTLISMDTVAPVALIRHAGCKTQQDKGSSEIAAPRSAPISSRTAGLRRSCPRRRARAASRRDTDQRQPLTPGLSSFTCSTHQAACAAGRSATTAAGRALIGC